MATPTHPSAVQAILDSLTRCFHPSDGSPAPPPAPATPRPAAPRAASSSATDDDPYLHRHLAIFRTTSEDLAAQGLSRLPPGRRNTLVDSDDGDVARLAGRARREQQQGCFGADDPPAFRPAAALLGLLRDPLACLTTVGAPHLGGAAALCFAVPVRTDDPDDLSDWELTAAEYARRRAGGQGLPVLCGVPDVPRSPSGEATANDEESITSASYFDQKHSHLVETRPPVPLWWRDRILVSAQRTDEIFRLVQRRQREGSGKPGGGDRSPPLVPRGSPKRSPKAQRGKAGSGTPRSLAKGASRSPAKKGASRASRSSKGTGGGREDFERTPAAKSSSVSEAGSAETAEAVGDGRERRGQGRGRGPDVVHVVAAAR